MESEVKQLRKIPRVDNLLNQPRQSSGYAARMVYLVLVTLFIGSLAYYLVGSMFVLSIDGTVLSERSSVGAGFSGKITDVYIKEGDKVETGTLLVRVESLEIARELAELALRDSELAAREGQIRGKLAWIEAVGPLAERTADETSRTFERFDSISQSGLVPALVKDTALRASLQEAEHVAELASLKSAAELELELLEKSRAISSSQIETVKAIYANGFLRAAIPGIVGARVPDPGQVVKFGDDLMQINGGDPYVLAYLPDEYLFRIEEGMRVNVSGGGWQVKGSIDAILPVADALPAEFQNMFRPRDRSRLLRVRLDEASPFAFSQKVTISGCAFGACWAR